MAALSKYLNYSDTQLEEHFSNFLIDSWSYSKLGQFLRNQKVFEWRYIYNERGRVSASTVAGTAYHHALDRFFNSVKANFNDPSKWFDLVDLEKFAFDHIEEVPAYKWKIQKTTPDVEACKEKAIKDVSALLRHFYAEKSLYLDNIEEIIFVEVYADEFLVINGVDIPLPCHMKIDLVVKTKQGKIAIIDHKSKTSFSDQEEVKLIGGRQAITYTLGFEAKTGITVDEVIFIEAKISKNKDLSPQLLDFPISMTVDNRRLFEFMLYDGLRAMIYAVSDPDHVYTINDSDNFVDRAELFEFYCKTLLAEVEDFPIAENKKPLIEKRLRKIRDAQISSIDTKIIKKFKQHASEFIQYDYSNKNMTSSEKIENSLKRFGIDVKVAHEFSGYSSNTYLLSVSANVKVSSIHSHKLDIANALDVATVRIGKHLTVFDKKSYLSVELSKDREKDLFFDKKDLVGLKIPIGRDNFGNVMVWDLDNHSTPHALIGGATGSGKSVCIKSTIEFALLAGLRVVIFDPKFEFTNYSEIKGVAVYNEILDIENQMLALVNEMNEKVKLKESSKTLVIFDEFADALAQSRSGKALDVYENVEEGFYRQSKEEILLGLDPQPKIVRKKTGTLNSLDVNLRILVQKGRSVGYRVMAGTQRASVKIIDGDIKANFPVVICFALPKALDSQVMIEEPGAETLCGDGDGLMKSPQYRDTVRFQGYFKP